jgi:hypothetical protein
MYPISDNIVEASCHAQFSNVACMQLEILCAGYSLQFTPGMIGVAVVLLSTAISTSELAHARVWVWV